MKRLLRSLAFVIFLAIGYYILKIETHRYESVSITQLKDLSKKQSMELGALALGQTSNTMQDSKVLELYIRSNEMFQYIDGKYSLSTHYTSNELDKYQRLYHDAPLALFEASNKNLLKKYNENLHVVFDEPSGTLSLSFIHTNPEIAKEILEEIIKYSDIVINKFSKENAQVALDFTEKQIAKDKATFNASIKKLIDYQNKHHTIDPNIDVERKNTILSGLEMELIKLQVEYRSKSKSYNLNGSEMKILRETVSSTKKSIASIKKEIVGAGDMNANVFNFELLRNNMEFSKEIYKQALINQEELRLEVNQNAKHLITVSKPTLSDNYTYPKKLWDIFTLLIIVIFIYNILMTIGLIIRDHRD